MIALSMFVYSCASSPQKTENPPVAENPQASANPDENFFLENSGDNPATDPSVKGEGTAMENSGYASWYGKELQGKPTASGELFDMNKFTAAHRTIPMNSIVLVKNKDNGKKQLVRINDRGPYVEGRIIDVSYAAARDMGFAEKGVAPVEIEVIQEGQDDFLSKLAPPARTQESVEETPVENNDQKKEDGLDLVEDDTAMESSEDEAVTEADEGGFTFPDGKKPSGYTIQTGAFKKEVNAEKYREELEDKYDLDGYVGKKGKFHYVLLGNFKTKEKAKEFYKKLRKSGVDVVYKGKVDSAS